ncbi:MAG: response regulator [Myxococcaceae bacterium]
MLASSAPSLVLAFCEVGSEQMASLLAVLAAYPRGAPLVLVCQDVREAAPVQRFRTGLVELIKEPFNPRLHPNRLMQLLMELPMRPGGMKGRAAGPEIGALVGHLQRTRRSGALVVNEGEPDEGRALFLNGSLKSARWGEALNGPAVINALAASAEALTWSFNEGQGGADTIVDLEEADEPFVLEGQGGERMIGKPIAPAPVAAPQPFVAPKPPPPPQFNYSAPAPMPSPVAPPPRPSAPPMPTVAPPTPEEQAQDTAATTILFVDDDATLGTMFSTYFSKRGYPVTVASDGLEAMQLLSGRPFDVVIADLNMPRLDGWGLLKEIRDDFRTKESVVALFSCQDDYRESLRAVHSGAQAYYPKTLKLSALEEQVRELMEPRRRFKRLLDKMQSVTVPLSALGARWVLETVAACQQTCTLDATDGWTQWRFVFHVGRLMQVRAKMGAKAISGKRAVMTFLANRGAEGTLAFGGIPPGDEHANQSLKQLLDEAVTELNEEQKRLRAETMREATKLDVDADLYRLYAQVGPQAWMPIVRALCEEHLGPREVMSKLNVPPQEVAAVLSDLMRRRVVSLRK